MTNEGSLTFYNTDLDNFAPFHIITILKGAPSFFDKERGGGGGGGRGGGLHQIFGRGPARHVYE